MKFKKILLNNIGLKILALLFALVTWFYIGEATKEGSEDTALQKLFLSRRYISKVLYVKLVFVGSVPAGHELDRANTKVTPESILVIGPPRVLSNRKFITTKPIDLGEHTRNKSIEVELGGISPSMQLEKAKVTVDLAIKKAQE